MHAATRAFLSLSLTSAPALLLGFTLAGVISALLGHAQVSLFGGPNRASQAIRGVFFGLPLPVCSCGVVPMYQSLIQRGVPVTAGLAFLIATPELGIDALLLSVPLLGWPMTLARVAAAFLVALLVSMIVATGHSEPHRSHAPAASATSEALSTRLLNGLRYGLVDLVDHTLPWILFGLALAALVEPLLDHALLHQIPNALQVPLAAVIGLPLYVCASGATPLVAVAMHKGISAGAALTFLLAGPATNVTTFGVLAALHGRRLAIRFGITLTCVAAIIGWGVDLIGVEVIDLGHPGEAHAHGSSPLEAIALVAMAAIGLASIWRQGGRGMMAQLLDPIHDH